MAIFPSVFYHNQLKQTPGTMETLTLDKIITPDMELNTGIYDDPKHPCHLENVTPK
jgi:hypothetical protein